MKKIFGYTAVLLLTLLVACKDTEFLGEELLEADGIEIAFTDTIIPIVKTVLDDSVITAATNGPNITNYRHLSLGEIVDGVFGATTSKIYATSAVMSSTLPEFEDAEFDSLVLVIPYDIEGRYGDTTATHDVKVYRLDAFPSSSPVISDRMDTLYSFETFSYASIPVGEKSIVPNYRDTVFAYNPTVDSILGSSPELRIKLDDALGMEMIDTSFVETDSAYQVNIRGFFMESMPSSNSFMGLNISNTSSLGTTAKLALYYHQDTIKKVHNFSFGTFKHLNFEHDYAGSQVESVLDQAGADVAFLQGMAGVKVEVDLSDIYNIGTDVGINYAELEFTVDGNLQAEQGDELPQLLAVYEEDGSTQSIRDIQLGNNELSLINATFGGQTSYDADTDKTTYSLKITNHIIALLNKEITNPVITIVPPAKVETPERSVLIGNNGSDDQVKLKLVVTKP